MYEGLRPRFRMPQVASAQSLSALSPESRSELLKNQALHQSAEASWAEGGGRDELGPGRTSRPQSKGASADEWSAGVLRLCASTLARRCAPLRMPALAVRATAHAPFL